MPPDEFIQALQAKMLAPGDQTPELTPQKLEKDEALIWFRGNEPQRF